MRRRVLPSAAGVAAAAMLAMSLALFAGGVRAFAELRDMSERTTSFALAGAGVTQEDAEEACRTALERGAGAVALWEQTFGFAQAEGAPAAADVAVVGFAGDARLLAPELPTWPLAPGECVLSGEASRRLFGENDAAGETVLVDGEALEVAGVAEDGRAFVLRPGATGAFVRVVAPARDADGFPVTEELLGSALGARVKALDYRSLAPLAFAGLFLYPLALVAATGALCLRVRKNRLIDQAACGAALAFGAIGATAAFAGALPAFGGYLPSRWSDFPAWGEAARAWADGVGRAVFAQQGVFDEPVLVASATCLACAAGALAALATGLALARTRAEGVRGKHAKGQVG